MLGDGLPCLDGSRGGAVAVVLAALDRIHHGVDDVLCKVSIVSLVGQNGMPFLIQYHVMKQGLIPYLMRREVAKDGGVADGEGDHLLLRVGLDHHRLQDVPDRVERVLGQVGRGQGAPPLLVVPHLVGLTGIGRLGLGGDPCGWRTGVLDCLGSELG